MADPVDTVVRQEDFLAFLKGYAPERKRAGEKDLLNGRYRILSNQPIAELSSPYAKAYVARDENTPDASLYALVFDPGVPLRQKNINALRTFRHPAMVSLLADGLVETGSTSETRYVCILEKPAGQTLAQLLARRMEPMPESLLIHQFLRPLTEILTGFAKLGISHNRIHPGNVYVSGGHIILGECISEPSGFSQDPVFEPVERMITLPRGKADYAPAADCYALAMLALHLALGFPPFAQTGKEVLIRTILSTGAYHTLVLPWELPASLQDLFRGVLNDGRRDRWDAQTIDAWLSDKRFNLIMPNTPQETSRGFEFGDTVYFNRKFLAYSIWQNWADAKLLLADNRLIRWLTIHAHRQDTADAIAKLTPASGTLSAQQENDAINKIITLLDPGGPIRFRQIAVAPEGIGPLMAHATIAERHEDVRALQTLIDNDLVGFWIEQQKANPDYALLTPKFQKVRNHARMKGLGFGIERSLYDLNPTLPCLSPALSGRPAMTLAELLGALDATAPQRAAANEAVGDTHIAAFIASHLDITREIKLQELNSLPMLMTHPDLIMLKLLAQAQKKAGNPVLKGLGHWIGMRLMPLFDGMHSKAKQRKLQTDLRAAANKGSISAIADIMLSPQAFEADIRDFKRATADYAALKENITALKTGKGLAYEASVKGRGVAQSIAYSVCLATVYMTLKTYFHL